MSTIFFFVLNLDKNKDRYKHITKKLDSLFVQYKRIKAVEGGNMENDIDCKNILKLRLDLLYKEFQNISSNEKWIYDGTTRKSFPNCSLYGNDGTKGLTISNIKAFNAAKDINCEWFCVLEDDAEINLESYDNIIQFINDPLNSNVDIVLLDSRHYGWGGCSGMLYNKKIINQLIIDLHPLSHFSINSHLYGDPNLANLWDWKMWKYVGHINKNFRQLPCIDSGNFDSTINC